LLRCNQSFADEDEAQTGEREGSETLSLDGQTIGIRTSAIDEKCQAFETMVIYCSTLQARFAPYLSQSLELVLPSLNSYFTTVFKRLAQCKFSISAFAIPFYNEG
jgi:importin-5